jgi:hypothetical protein
VILFGEKISNTLKNLFKDIYFLFILGLIVAIFIFKWEDLFLPFFSDELWAYGPAIRKMSVFGPSLLPSSLDLSDHWAHPLLFFFLASLWCTFFGASLFIAHLFAALLASFLLLLMYLIIKQLFNRQIAFYSTILFAAQSIFLGQYNLLLPEILLTIFTFLVIYHYQKNNLKYYVLFGIALVLTKESGVFPLLAIGLWTLIKDVFYDKTFSFTKSTLIKYLTLSLPFFALIGHFLLLKAEYGWYIMPLRTDSFEFSWEVYHERLMSTIHYIFIDQGRKPLSIGLFFIGILFYTRIKWIYRVLIIVVSFTLMKIFFGYWSTIDFVEYLIVPLVFLIVLKTVFLDAYKYDKTRGGFVSITSILMFSYVLFTSSFFDSRRYLFFLIPLFIIVVVYYLDQIPKYSRYLVPIFSVVVIGFLINYQINDKNQGDDTNHYQDICIIQKEAVGFLEKNYEYSQPIQTTFLLKHSLERPLTGYLSTLSKFSNVNSISKLSIYNENSVFVFANTELPDYYNEIKSNNNLKLVKKFERRNAWIEIYKN